ncbi:acyl-CoA dehydrogenase [Streptomyces sp. NPDC096310]|uniref:acyl-CoA dehydrogenase family protein n=1 Tax=Streptomyces sp. NPDC096310 TaxID=3366082 RepID=UPI00381D5E33
MINSGAVDAGKATARRLTRVLYGDDFEREHGPWRRFAADGLFRSRPDTSPGERLSLAYERLRAVNGAIDSPAGLAADPRGVAALHEWLAPVDPSFTTVAGIHYNLFLGSLLDLDHTADGDPGDAERDLTDFLTLRRIGTFLCTEVAHGNDAVALETTATYDRARDGFVLHTPHAGAQKFMPNTSTTGGAKSGVVAARLLVDGADHGVFLFLAPLTDGSRTLPGVRVRLLPERFGSPLDHCVTSFDRVFVGRDALLGGVRGRLGRITGDGAFSSAERNRRRRLLASIGRVNAGKLSMSAGALGGARVALALAVRYGGHRLITGPRAAERVPVFAHRSHHGPLTGGLATVFAMTLLHRTVVDAWETRTEANRGETERLVAVAKGWITWRAREIIVECRERCGAQGLLEHNGMTEMLANIEGAITAEGDNTAIYAKAAAELLFSAGNPAGGAVGNPVRVAAGVLAPVAVTDADMDIAREPAPGTDADRDTAPDADPGADSGERDANYVSLELSDTGHLGDLLLAVEQLWLDRARRRMGRAPQGDPLVRWNAASGAALRAVEAHAYRRAAEAYTAAERQLWKREPRDTEPGAEPGSVPASAPGSAPALLRSLHLLFALQWIDRNSGDLLAHGLLAPRHLDELPEAIERLIAELATYAPTLVESFALPEEMLADRPIAGPGYADAYDDPEGAWTVSEALPRCATCRRSPPPSAPLSDRFHVVHRLLRFINTLRNLPR